MPTFDTPTPITVELDLAIGDVRLAASERVDTVVDVRPGDPAEPADVEAAERTLVELSGDTLLVRTPRQRGYLGLGRGRAASVDVTIELPAGSGLHGHAAVGAFTATGRLGTCDLKSGTGDVHLAEVGDLRIGTAAGDVTVDRITGAATVSGAAGETRIGRVDGSAVVKGAVGAIRVGSAGGDLRVNSASGDIVVDRAEGSLVAKTAAGKIRVGAVTGGSVALESGGGMISVGIPEGTTAWVDARSIAGSVRNNLESTGAPEDGARTVQIRARTAFGDITIERATAGPAAAATPGAGSGADAEQA